MKSIYICIYTNIINNRIIELLNFAHKYGNIIIGIYTDYALLTQGIDSKLDEQKRSELFENISIVKKIIFQNSNDYREVLTTLKPDYVLHIDQFGNNDNIKTELINILNEYGGEIIECPKKIQEDFNISNMNLYNQLSFPEFRRNRLKKLISNNLLVKALEVHDGLTGLIAEKTFVDIGIRRNQFDAMWISSLCDSTARGKPDIEVVDITSRIQTISDVIDVTTKPIIFDADTGGHTEHFAYHIRVLDRLGVSAVIIEDKIGLKRNSLFGNEVKQFQDTIEHFCNKIKAGKNAQISNDLMIIARIESLILEQGMADALKRAFAYIDAGADGIMIHSRKQDPSEIFEFCDKLRLQNKDIPIVVVPTSFDSVTEDELAEHGINIVIYANQLTRSAYFSMQKTAKEILINHRAMESNESLIPFKEIINLIDLL